jgi:ribonuclease-3
MATMNDRTAPLDELEKLLGHQFADRELLQRALRHGSADDARAAGSYERLEFLGDAVLGHAMALMLFDRFPRADQGLLTKMRAHLIRSRSLASQAALLGLDGWIEVGRSEEIAHGRERTALLEDVFEAILGAIALDGGWPAAESFVRRSFAAEVDGLDEHELLVADAKSALQEAAQGRGLALPEYREVGVVGPDHRRRWAFEVIWDGEVVARGEGSSKRSAQQRAARRALARLGIATSEGHRR